jgi:serine/threonine-protein kinase
MWLALCERDGAAARQVLAAISSDGSEDLGTQYPKAWYEGVVARALGDSDGARAAFTLARAAVEKTVREQPTYAQPLSLLGMIDAGLGHKEDAIREGRRAVELLPVSKDALSGPALVENLALIYAWTGEKEQACKQLAVVTSIPYDLSYGKLRLHPSWDSLRGNPRFEKIVASLAPKQ